MTQKPHRLSVLICVIFLGYFSSPSLSFSEQLDGRVVKIADGDTVTLKTASGKLKIRMAGIDAPELDHSRKPGCDGQPLAKEAKNALSREIPVGSTVKARIVNSDRYGRSVAFLFVGNKDVNLWMVRNGWAVPYMTPRYLSAEYERAMTAAQKEHLGVWGLLNPEPPSDYRKRCQGRSPGGR